MTLVVGAVIAGGAGTAAAQTTNIGTVIQQIEADFFTSVGSSDRVGCDNGATTTVNTVLGDTSFKRAVSTGRHAGESGDYAVQYNFVSGGESRYLTRLTEYPPSPGYKLSSIEVRWTELIGGQQIERTDESPHYIIDDLTGAVTLTGAYPLTTPRSTNFTFHFDAIPQSATEGSVQKSGAGVTISGMEPLDWPVMEGNNFVVPKMPLTCGPGDRGGQG